jgi:hypothetical protein
VRRACEAHGWPFGGGSSLALRDVQTWLHHGRSLQAVQLLELFGPFPGTATDGEPQVALAAAVFEDVGDKLLRGSRGRSADAYRRAAAAQRAFAACARAPGKTRPGWPKRTGSKKRPGLSTGRQLAEALR